jgi:hypothetical protein
MISTQFRCYKNLEKATVFIRLRYWEYFMSGRVQKLNFGEKEMPFWEKCIREEAHIEHKDSEGDVLTLKRHTL